MLLSCSTLFAQSKYTLSGTVSETETGETLIGVNVIIPELQAGAVTNEYGFYSITVPEGNYKVVYSILGFTSVSQDISLDKNTVRDVTLSENLEALDEVVIKADVEKMNIRKPQMSVNTRL